MAIKIKNFTIIDDSRNIVDAGIATVTSVSIGNTQVISSDRQLQNIASLDAVTTATIESAIQNAPNTFTDLQVTGVSTFTNGPIFVGSGSSTGTLDQKLQVTGGAYVSGSIGIGITNPSQTGAFSKVHVSGGNLKLDSNNQLNWDGTYPTSIEGISGTSGQIRFAAGNGNRLTLTQNNVSDFSPEDNLKIDLGTASNQFRNIWLGGTQIIGSGTSTGTADQKLQVTGDAYVSGSIGIGTTNPTSKLTVGGDVFVSGVVTASNFYVSNNVVGAGGSFDNLYVVGLSTFIGLVDANGGLNVTGGSTLDNLNVTGLSTFAGITTVTGPTLFTKQLSVSGVATFQSDVKLGDGDILNFGNSNDLQIYHTGSETYISDEGTGDLNIRSSKLNITDTGNNLRAVFDTNTTNGSVSLYYGFGQKKFETTGYGATVFGTLQTQQLNVSGIITATEFTTGSGNLGFTTNTISGPSEIIIDPSPVGVGTTSGVVRIKGDLYVDGTEFIVNSTTIELADFNVGIASTVGTNALLDGAGIGIGSANIRKTLTWSDASTSLKSSENFDLASSKVYKINGTEVLSSNTLGSNVVNSSLTSVGTLGQLQVTGVSTFTNGPVFVGSGTSTGTLDQKLQVTGGAYVSGNLGIGTTNPQTKLEINGILGFSTSRASFYYGNNIRIGDKNTGPNITPHSPFLFGGINNIFIGVGVGKSTIQGSDNIAIGQNAFAKSGSPTNVSNNVVIGANAGVDVGSSDNVIIGPGAGLSFYNQSSIAIGVNAGKYSTGNVSHNTFVGPFAGQYVTGGYNSIFGSYAAGFGNFTGENNSIFGRFSGQVHTTGSYNNFFGAYSGTNNTTGSYNSFFGNNSGNNNTVGSYNIFFGSYTGISTSASNKVILGSGKQFNQLFDAPDTTKDLQFAVGLRTDANPSKYWLVGNENFNVGIGTTNPTSKLFVGGNAKFVGVVTATSFYGDGSTLSNITASEGNTYYVSVDGNDSNPGTSLGSPFLTLKQALSVATSGDTVRVGGGTFSEIFPLTIPAGVTVRGLGLRATIIQPTVGTQQNDGFLLNGETTLEDLTIANIYEPGVAIKFANNMKTTTRSPYIQRITVFNKGSITSATDPYGFDTAHNPPTSYKAGRGALIDGSVVDPTTLEPAMLFNECTFITPNNIALEMTNGARTEWVNCFSYFADKAIYAHDGAVGLASTGYVRIKTTGITGTTPAANDELYYLQTNSVSGTYQQVGTALTITRVGHGLTVGDRIYADFTSGTADDGFYSVTNYVGINTFTITMVGSATTSGNISYKEALGFGTVRSYDSSVGLSSIRGKGEGLFELPSTRLGKTVTAYGDAQLSTNQKKFGTASLSLDGTGDYARCEGGTDFNFSGNFTAECWIYPTSVTGSRHLFALGTETTGRYHLSLESGVVTGNFYGSASTTFGGSISTNTWTHIALVRSGSTITAYVNGTALGTTETNSSTINNTGQLTIGADNSGANAFVGYIDEVRISNTARYTGNFSTATSQFNSDGSDKLLLHFDGVSGSVSFTDSSIPAQDIRWVRAGVGIATATKITLADYQQFGAEMRSIGSAAVFGNTGVTADGPGSTLRLFAFNFGHVGSGKDFSQDVSLVNQVDEVITPNNGKVYFVSIDQSGDFRVGDAFYVNQQDGTVNFGGQDFTINSISDLNVTDGTNTTTITPTSITVGNLQLSGNELTTTSGDITINPSGINSTTVSGDLTVTGNINSTANATVNGTISNPYTTYGSVVSTTSTTSPVGIHSALPIATYRSVEYTIQATQGSNFHATKILALHDGSIAYPTEYATIYNNAIVSTFDVDVSGGNIRLLATPASASLTNYTINFIATKI